MLDPQLRQIFSSTSNELSQLSYDGSPDGFHAWLTSTQAILASVPNMPERARASALARSLTRSVDTADCSTVEQVVKAARSAAFGTLTDPELYSRWIRLSLAPTAEARDVLEFFRIFNAAFRILARPVTPELVYYIFINALFESLRRAVIPHLPPPSDDEPVDELWDRCKAQAFLHLPRISPARERRLHPPNRTTSLRSPPPPTPPCAPTARMRPPAAAARSRSSRARPRPRARSSHSFASAACSRATIPSNAARPRPTRLSCSPRNRAAPQLCLRALLGDPLSCRHLPPSRT